MAIILAVTSALTWGAADFLAGIASRRIRAESVTAISLTLGIIATGTATLLSPGSGPSIAACSWGMLGGLGNGCGSLLLYRGLAIGQMGLVTPLSGVMTAIVPALVGVLTGNRLSPLSAIGICAAVPAIGLVSWSSGSGAQGSRSGALYGLLAGCGFAVAFISLDRAGTTSGAWPVLANSVTAALIASIFATRRRQHERILTRTPATALVVGAGLLLGLANVSFFAATGAGELAIVAVLAALYPGVTTLLARFILFEHWTRRQGLGLMLALAAVVLSSVGSA